MKKNNKIAIIQPAYPHYRKEFFLGLKKEFSVDFFYAKRANREPYSEIIELNIKQLKSFNINKAVFFLFPISYFFKYKIVVISGEFKYITNWFILLFAKLTNTKIIIWWHGLDWRKRIHDIEELSFISIFFGKLASGMFLYTEKEKIIWEKYINKDRIHVLNNSIDTRSIIQQYARYSKNKLEYKKKHNITQPNILIFSARFTNSYRRIDTLLKVLQVLDSNLYGFIIIGDGPYKPDFKVYDNVYDYGALYDDEIKKELFIIADLYFQPGGIGLSVIEAMAYSLPILTLERSIKTKHGVEYGYLEHGLNAYIANDLDDIVEFVNLYFYDMNMKNKLRNNAFLFIEGNLNIEKMINNATNVFKQILNEKK